MDELGGGIGLDDDGFQLVVIDCNVGSASQGSPFRGTLP